MGVVRTFYECPFEAELEVDTGKLALLIDLLSKNQLRSPEETWRSAGHVYITLFRSVSTVELAILCHDHQNEKVMVAVTERKKPGDLPPISLDMSLTQRERTIAGHIAKTHGMSAAQAELLAREHERLAQATNQPPPDPPRDPKTPEQASEAFNDQYALDHVVKIASTLGVPFKLAVGATADQKPAGEKTPTTK